MGRQGRCLCDPCTFPVPTSSTCPAAASGVMGLPLVRDRATAEAVRGCNERGTAGQRDLRETRVAVVVRTACRRTAHRARQPKRGVVGNICSGQGAAGDAGHAGRVRRHRPERAAFLHANDIFQHSSSTPARATMRRPVRRCRSQIPITELLRDGAEIVGRWSRIRSAARRPADHPDQHPSRYMGAAVYARVLGISARIEDEDERARLKSLMTELYARRAKYGYIAHQCRRAAGRGACGRRRLPGPRVEAGRGNCRQRAKVGSCVYEDPAWVASRGARPSAATWGEGQGRCVRPQSACSEFAAQQYMPGTGGEDRASGGVRPIFDLYGVEDEIGRAGEGSAAETGGYLGSTRPEAMTTVDVNTGSSASATRRRRSTAPTWRPRRRWRASCIAQPGRDHHHRLHRHGRCRARRGAGCTPEKSLARPRQDHGLRLRRSARCG